MKNEERDTMRLPSNDKIPNIIRCLDCNIEGKYNINMQSVKRTFNLENKCNIE